MNATRTLLVSGSLWLAAVAHAATGWTPTITPQAAGAGGVPKYKISGKKDSGCELRIGATSFKGQSAFNGVFSGTDDFFTNCTGDAEALSVATPTAPGMLNIGVPVLAYLFNVPGLHVSDVVAMDGRTVLERVAYPWPAVMQNSPKLLSNMLDKGFSVTFGTIPKGTVLYHGTSKAGADSIWKRGYDVSVSDTELGRAFYTTLNRDLAEEYATPAGVVVKTEVKADQCFAHLHDKIKNDVGGFVWNRPVDSLRRLLTWSGKGNCVLSRGEVTGPGAGASGTEYAFWTTGQTTTLTPPVRVPLK
ncbi:hypothetical protein ACQ86G_18290 [Roseateles chitinivorans]|uniref:hypothetical protein n=1 Tax=Roseateles chitinivorans TaxID=2917965 RepID=UPI003D67BAA1